MTTGTADTPLLFVDVETTGLDPRLHEIWEIAYAHEHGPVHSSTVGHMSTNLTREAAQANHYFERTTLQHRLPRETLEHKADFEREFQRRLLGATIVAANPPFDTAMLRARYGSELWHYRTIDIETYAMPLLGLERPPSLLTVVTHLNDIEGADIPEPDHTAEGDVTALRAAFLALRYLYVNRSVRD